MDILPLLMLYAVAFFLHLKDGPGNMLISFLLYMVVILEIPTTAFLRVGKVLKISYHCVLLGAVLFLISDSLVPIHTF